MGRHRREKPTGRQLRLRLAGAVLLAGSACIHLALYLTGYRSIPTIGWLFLVQVVVGFTLAAGALVIYSRLAAAAGAAFALSTLAAYLLAVRIGLFGFREIRTRAGIAAGLIEVAAFATLAIAALTAGPAMTGPATAGPAMTGPAMTGPAMTGPATAGLAMTGRVRAVMRTTASMVMVAVGAVSVLALALFGVAEANAAGPPPTSP